jgi:hypothetical protein
LQPDCEQAISSTTTTKLQPTAQRTIECLATRAVLVVASRVGAPGADARGVAGFPFFDSPPSPQHAVAAHINPCTPRTLPNDLKRIKGLKQLDIFLAK